MTVSNFHARYFEALGLNQESEIDRHKIADALKRAHELRRFEIENYWKRATYFWAFQAVAFAALGFLRKDGSTAAIEQIALPAGLGVLTALAGWLTARGSKFWQENWEAHVDMLEGAVEGRLTQVILFRGKPKFSVSRTNELLLLVLCIGWLLALILAVAAPFAPTILKLAACWYGRIVFAAVVLAAGFMFFTTRTRLSGRRFEQNTDGWADIPGVPKPPYSVIWRDPPGGHDAL